MTIECRQQLYSTIFRFMIVHHIDDIPIELAPLCKKIGVELIPLTRITAESDLSPNEIFDIWGNSDGVVHRYQDRHCIAYNDTVSSGRKRFTICEELSHMILGHTQDTRFDIRQQNYCPATYRRYEEEARIGAGILMCNPKFFYQYESELTPRQLAELCGLTLCCANTRFQILKKYKSEILQNPDYIDLPQPKLSLLDPSAQLLAI